MWDGPVRGIVRTAGQREKSQLSRHFISAGHPLKVCQCPEECSIYCHLLAGDRYTPPSLPADLIGMEENVRSQMGPGVNVLCKKIRATTPDGPEEDLSLGAYKKWPLLSFALENTPTLFLHCLQGRISAFEKNMSFCSPRVTVIIQILAWMSYCVIALASDKLLVISKINAKKKGKGDNKTVCVTLVVYF